MKIVSEDKILEVKIEYDNSEGSNDRDDVHKYLNDKYAMNFRIVRMGPFKNKTGLIIVHVYS